MSGQKLGFLFHLFGEIIDFSDRGWLKPNQALLFAVGAQPAVKVSVTRRIVVHQHTAGNDVRSHAFHTGHPQHRGANLA